jgi:hypothetical protein
LISSDTYYPRPGHVVFDNHGLKIKLHHRRSPDRWIGYTGDRVVSVDEGDMVYIPRHRENTKMNPA